MMEVDISEPVASSSRSNVVNVPTSDSFYDTNPQPPFNYASVKGHDPVICIDNGSLNWRAGFSNMSKPYIDRPSSVSKYKDRKNGRTVTLIGKDTLIDSNSRSNARSMYDGDLLVAGDVLESALDYTFIKLGIDTGRIEHPIVMTERLANPLLTRASTPLAKTLLNIVTSELLFELYGAPSVAFGVDSLFAFSRQKHADGMALSLGHNSTTVIPVVEGRGVLSRAKRIPWGGAQASEVMLRLAQLKYPAFPVKVTPSQATFMMQDACYFSTDYESEIRSLESPTKLAGMTKVMQFPFVQPDVVEKTDAEIAALAERRKEHGKRLQEMQSKQRAEKLAAKQVEMEEYKALLLIRDTDPDEFQDKFYDTPFDTPGEMESWIKKTESDIKRKQKKDAGEDIEPEEDPTFPLVDRPDTELNEEEVREKKKQRLMKAGWEARVKIREEKKREKERQAEVRRQEEEFRIAEPDAWSAKMRAEQDAVILRMQERKKRRAQLGNRKSAASQSRMKTIAALAKDDDTGKKRKKNGTEKDDGFGRDDADWSVYREIGGDDESDAEEEDQNLLQNLETQLLQYDPAFTEEDTMEGRAHAKNALINAFVRGGSDGKYNPDDLRQSYQLHLNVERIRVPETFFQPSMFGVDSAGLGEIAGWILNGFEEEQRRRMMQCIFVTGGGANIPHLVPRLRNTLTPVLPFRTPLKIVAALDGDPALDAWRGMAAWSATAAAKEARVTRQEYEEFGGEWLKEHQWGNLKP